MTYATLVAAVSDATENNDVTFVANIPVFVANAEKRIYQTVKIPALRKNQTGVLTPSSPYMTLPTDYIDIWELAVLDFSGIYTYLLPKDVSFMREAYPLPTVGGVPKYYSQFDNNTLFIAPTPDQLYPVEMHYFAYPESIVTAATTWLDTFFPNVLLYASLIEAANFMKSDADTVQTYTVAFDTAMGLLRDYASGNTRSTTYR